MGAVLNKRFACKMFRLTTVLVLSLAAVALGKVRTSPRPGFMMGNPLYDPIWEDDSKIVGGEEVVPGSRPYQLSFQYDFCLHFGLCHHCRPLLHRPERRRPQGCCR